MVKNPIELDTMLLTKMISIAQLTVQVTDQPDSATTPKYDITEVIIHVLRNPNPPVFIPEYYNVTITEYSPVGTKIISVTATDADPSNVRKR